MAFDILVNSTDKYADCWQPFFTLFRKYWPGDVPTILLNCETRDFEFADLQIVPVRNKPGDTWSQCLLNALNTGSEPYLLYLQDDYFLDTPVRVDVVQKMYAKMLANPEIGHIGLTTHGSPPSMQMYDEDLGLAKIAANSRYFISMQVALWKKEALKELIRQDENAWMLEIFGSMRARFSKYQFLTVVHEMYKPDPVFHYIHTGIIKGKWHKDIPAFFELENINVDFGKRGIIDPFKNIWKNKISTYKKLLSRPLKFRYLLGCK